MNDDQPKMAQFRDELQNATTDDEKLDIKSKIQGLVAAADKQIRNSQKEITFGVREWTIEVVYKKYSEGLESEDNELFIPDYQRSYKWGAKIASRFIESILLGFPIPYMYIADVTDDEDDELDGRVEIIDGSQRVRALHYFLTNDFQLKGLKELSTLEGFYFKDLSSGRQRRFLRESLRIIELKGEVNEGHRRDLFERINSGAKRLEPMEVRHGSDAASSAFYKDVIEKCANLDTFIELAPLSQKKWLNGDQRELVLRFFGYLNNIDNYTGFVGPFIDEYLVTSAQDITSVQEIKKLVDEFSRVMDFIKLHTRIGFRKTATSKTTPRARYEAIAVGTAFAMRESPGLDSPAIPYQDWLFEDEFLGIVSADSANNVSQLHKRINYVKNKVLGIESNA